MSRGRPSKFTQELADEICSRLSKGEPLTVICGSLSICDDTVRNWADADPAFSRDIARAREAGFDQIALDALSIADDGSRDYREGENGPIVDTDHIQRSKLRVETRLKLLAKWDPKRYGERQEIRHADPDGRAMAFVLIGSPEAKTSDEWQSQNE